MMIHKTNNTIKQQIDGFLMKLLLAAGLCETLSTPKRKYKNNQLFRVLAEEVDFSQSRLIFN